VFDDNLALEVSHQQQQQSLTTSIVSSLPSLKQTRMKLLETMMMTGNHSKHKIYAKKHLKLGKFDF